MIKGIFSKSKKLKYATLPSELSKNEVPEGIMTKCSNCKKIMYTRELQKNHKVCLNCGYHLPMKAYERMNCILDEATFVELNAEMRTGNPLQFPGYEDKIAGDIKKTNMNEAVVTGTGEINGKKSSNSCNGFFFPDGEYGFSSWRKNYSRC